MWHLLLVLFCARYLTFQNMVALSNLVSKIVPFKLGAGTPQLSHLKARQMILWNATMKKNWQLRYAKSRQDLRKTSHIIYTHTELIDRKHSSFLKEVLKTILVFAMKQRVRWRLKISPWKIVQNHKFLKLPIPYKPITIWRQKENTMKTVCCPT